MGKVLIALLLMLFFAPVFGAGPVKYADYQVYVEVREDGTLNETISITFPEKVTSFTYYLLHPTLVSFFDANNNEIDACNSSLEGPGTIIYCEGIYLSRISMQFEYDKLVKKNDSYFTLSDQYIFSTPTDDFSLRAILPTGYVVAQKDSKNQTIQPYFPMDAVQGTDGRQIYVEWNRPQPKLGGIFSYSVSYEKGIMTADNSGFLVFAGAAGSVVVALLILIYFRKKPTLKEYGLNEDERKILDVLLKENRISQKKISRETGFSKAHVSRIAKKLEEREIIERKRKGRTYEVILRK